MTQTFDNPADFADEALDGFVAANRGYVARRSLLRTNCHTAFRTHQGLLSQNRQHPNKAPSGRKGSTK
jgi:hypothetical protein